MSMYHDARHPASGYNRHYETTNDIFYILICSTQKGPSAYPTVSSNELALSSSIRSLQ